jgi:DNA-directed RNA polymerase subunit RPC12/RpoP
MPDREKVIKGLEHCQRIGSCGDCPYQEDLDPDAGCGMHGDALTLLLEQEPVEPTANDEVIRVKYNCGECGYLVGFVSTIHNDMQYRAKYCPDCGKKVAWS